LRDLEGFATELLRPSIVRSETMALATSVAFPGIKGLLPGIGTFDPLDWGLGFELRDDKMPHWTGTGNSPGTFGHFGGAGTFLWVDPLAGIALVCLTDREFGRWALEAWPPFSDQVLAAESSA
jgi:CubicO group peptidase (beta-lactamase class C family)